jgi:hypothetical protein
MSSLTGTAAQVPVLCPSAPAKEGSILYGIVAGRTIGYLDHAVAVTAEDLESAGDRIEDRFRFARPCLRHCKNFENGCGLIGRLQAARGAPDAAEKAAERECAIRPQCQWFLTAGGDACRICPEIRRPGLGS